MSKLKAYSWGVIIPQSWNIDPVSISKKMDCRYYVAFHDKDKDPFGNAKPAHYHTLFRFSSQRWGTAIKDQLNAVAFPAVQNELFPVEPVEPKFLDNSLEKINDIRASINYLVHRGYPEKYQYETKVIQTNDPSALVALGLPYDEDNQFEFLQAAYFGVDKFVNGRDYVRACKPVILSQKNPMQRMKNIDFFFKHYEEKKEHLTFSQMADKEFSPPPQQPTNQTTSGDICNLPF